VRRDRGGIRICEAYDGAQAGIEPTRIEAAFRFACQPSHVAGAALVDPLAKEVSACFEWLELSKTDESKTLLVGSGLYRGFETIHLSASLSPSW
jgi:hypothetical protein